MDTEHRDKGLIAKLVVPLLEEMRRRGWLWHYLTAGDEETPVYVNELGHRQVAGLPHWVKLRKWRMLKGLLGIKTEHKVTAGFRMAYHSYRVRMVREFDERLDQLWEHARGDQPVEPVLDREYLEWRYTRHPSKQYQVLTVEDQGKLKGFAVLDRGMVLELLCQVDTDAYKTLAKALEKVWRPQGVGLSQAWVLGDRLAERALYRMGWREWKGRARPFGLEGRRALAVYPNPGKEANGIGLKPGQWRMMAGDVF